jgi:protein involved in polysaccharide export with SLBB domain
VRTLLLPLVLALWGCGTGVRSVTAPRPPTVDATLGPGDLFDVRVFEEADLSGSYRIGPDGTIDFPLVGRITAAGRLPSELADLLREKLITYMTHPQVSILVREMNSKHIIVYGQVQRPGAFPFTDPMTISQAISIAGGFTAMAAREKVRISRRKKGQQEVVEINLRTIAEGKEPNQFIYPGDEVYVPERLF